MAATLDQMIAWLLGELRKCDNDGVSIAILFDGMDAALKIDDAARNTAWDALVKRDDIILADDSKNQPLKKSALRKLDFDDLAEFSFGERKLRFAVEAKKNAPSADIVVDSIEVQTQPESVLGKRKEAPENEISTQPKKRGRPPKKKPSQPPSRAATPASIPVPQPEPAPEPVVPKKRGRPKKTKVYSEPAPLVPTSTAKFPSPILLDEPPARSTRGSRKAAKKLEEQSSEIPQPPLVPKQAKDAGISETLAQDEPTPGPQPEGIAGPSEILVHNTPPETIEENVPMENGDSAQVGDSEYEMATGDAQPTPPPAAPGGSGGVQSENAADEIHLKTPRKRRVHVMFETSRFPDDEEQRQAGVPRAYIKLAGTENPGATSISHSCVVLFKSSQLKDPEHLEKNKNGYVEAFAQMIAKNLIEVEDTTVAPKRKQRSYKRKERAGSSAAPEPKRRRTGKGKKATTSSASPPQEDAAENIPGLDEYSTELQDPIAQPPDNAPAGHDLRSAQDFDDDPTPDEQILKEAGIAGDSRAMVPGPDIQAPSDAPEDMEKLLSQVVDQVVAQATAEAMSEGASLDVTQAPPNILGSEEPPATSNNTEAFTAPAPVAAPEPAVPKKRTRGPGKKNAVEKPRTESQETILPPNIFPPGSAFHSLMQETERRANSYRSPYAANAPSVQQTGPRLGAHPSNNSAMPAAPHLQQGFQATMAPQTVYASPYASPFLTGAYPRSPNRLVPPARPALTSPSVPFHLRYSISHSPQPPRRQYATPYGSFSPQNMQQQQVPPPAFARFQGPSFPGQAEGTQGSPPQSSTADPNGAKVGLFYIGDTRTNGNPVPPRTAPEVALPQAPSPKAAPTTSLPPQKETQSDTYPNLERQTQSHDIEQPSMRGLNSGLKVNSIEQEAENHDANPNVVAPEGIHTHEARIDQNGSINATSERAKDNGAELDEIIDGEAPLDPEMFTRRRSQRLSQPPLPQQSIEVDDELDENSADPSNNNLKRMVPVAAGTLGDSDDEDFVPPPRKMRSATKEKEGGEANSTNPLKRKKTVAADDDESEDHVVVRPRKQRSVSKQSDGTSRRGRPAKNAPLSTGKLSTRAKTLTLLNQAQDVPVFEARARLACTLDDDVGNLIISKDSTTIEFFGLIQHPPETPILTLHIPNLTSNPIASAAGSIPMELRIKSKVDDTEVTHGFTFAAGKESLEHARLMREAIVAARIQASFLAGETYDRPVEVQRSILKPFHCELCDARFKNKGGLEYHVTKSNTICNPNYIPPVSNVCNQCNTTFKTEAGLAHHKTRARTACNPNWKPKQKKQPKPKESTPTQEDHEDTPEDILGDIVSDADDDYRPEDEPIPFREKGTIEESITPFERESSEDSIYVWARRTAGLPENQPNPSARDYKALNKETEHAQEIIKEVREHAAQEATLYENVFKPVLIDQEIANRLPDSQILDLPRVQHMVMLLIRGNDGIFPGKYSMWMACIGLWLKRHPNTSVLPRSTMVAKAIVELLRAEKILSLEFAFRFGRMGKKRKTFRQTILYIPGTNLENDRVEMLKELVAESHPAFYVPSLFAPPSFVLHRLQRMCCRILDDVLIEKPIEVDVEEEGEINDEDLILEEDLLRESDEDQPVPNTFVPRGFNLDVPSPDSYEDIESDVGSDEDFIDEDEPALESAPESESEVEMDAEAQVHVEAQVGEHGEPSKPSKPKRVRKPPRPRLPNGKRYRSPSANKRTSETMAKKWADIKAGKEANPFARRNPPKRVRGPRVPMTQEEKDKRAKSAHRRRAVWDSAPAYMPNTETGAWDQAPPIVLTHKLPATTRKNFSGRYVEPVTYMQSPNGAWNLRPFGHGANVIVARPARRADGNPNFKNYLKQIEKGHRPVVFPRLSNRVHLPAVPSKRLIETVTRQETVEPGLSSDAAKGGKGKRSYKRRKLAEDGPSPADSSDVRISATTGARMRIYNNGFPVRADPADNDLDNVDLRRGRGGEWTEAEILQYQEPKKLIAGAPLNPGMETVPPEFGLDPSIYSGNDEVDHGFIPVEYMKNLTWTTVTEIVDDSNPNDVARSWTLSTLTSAKSETTLRWEDAVAFTMENLPYHEITEADARYGFEASASHEPVSRPVVKTRRGVAPTQDIRKFSRYQLALPTDFDGLYKDMNKASRELGVTIAEPNEIMKNRQRIMNSEMPMTVEHRFIVAVCVVRILLGGLNLQVDWVLISTLFQSFSINYMAKHWIKLQKVKKQTIDRISNNFQEGFLTAYEAGDIAPIDFDHVLDYDWNKLVDWAMKNIDTSLANKPVVIPAKREKLHETFIYKELDRDDLSWRDMFFGMNVAIYKRVEAAASDPYTVSLSERSRQPQTVDEYCVAKSWARAAALTPDADFKQSVVRQKLESLNQELLVEVLTELTHTRIIQHQGKGRAIPERAYKATEYFNGHFKKHIKQPQFVEAVVFKRYLDTQFRAGVESVKLEWAANEGMITVTTSLQAHGRVRLVPVGAPMNRFGLTNGGYETKKIPRERLQFAVHIYPTKTYIYDDNNEILNSVGDVEPPRGGPMSEIPLWYGITDFLMPDMWRSIVAAVSQIAALRAGIGMRELRRIFKVMEEWELRLFMQWGEQVGLFKRLSDSVESWMADEWWWLIVGAFCMENDIMGDASREGGGVDQAAPGINNGIGFEDQNWIGNGGV